ncbi:hypothetical protein ABPD29_10000, partial [Secundilactobacillus paracollinoides]|uniref:hypothetical protein n=1 Tax=Secundilactobacillus paracollinoides TaxID=240427 RepID=UPI003F44B73E
PLALRNALRHGCLESTKLKKSGSNFDARVRYMAVSPCGTRYGTDASKALNDECPGLTFWSKSFTR